MEFSEALDAMKRYGDDLSRYRTELKDLNRRIETKSGNIGGLRQRADELSRAIGKASDNYDHAHSEWSSNVRRYQKSGRFAGEHGDGASRDTGLWMRGSKSTHAGVGKWVDRGIQRKAWLDVGGSNTTAYVPPEYSEQAIDFLAAATVLDKAGVTEHRTGNRELRIPHLTSDAPSGWFAEMAVIGSTDSTAEELVMTPQRVSVLTTISNEALADSHPDARTALGQSLLRSVALRVDKAAFEGSGTGNEPRGLKNVAGRHELTSGTNGASLTNLDPVADAIQKLLESNVDPEHTLAIVMHPRTWGAVSKLKSDTTDSNRPLIYTDGTPAGSGENAPKRTIYGQPVYLTSQLSITETAGTSADCSSIYVFDPAEFHVTYGAYSASVEVDSSRLFNQYASELRAVARVDFGHPNPLAIARISGVRP